MNNAKLTSRDADFMRVFAEFGFKAPQLAKEYEVHPDTARNVLNGTSHTGKGLPPSALRKLTDDQVRQIRAWAAEGLGEARIQNRLKTQGIEIGRSTIRQVINRVSYRDVL